MYMSCTCGSKNNLMVQIAQDDIKHVHCTCKCLTTVDDFPYSDHLSLLITAKRNKITGRC